MTRIALSVCLALALSPIVANAQQPLTPCQAGLVKWCRAEAARSCGYLTIENCVATNMRQCDDCETVKRLGWLEPRSLDKGRDPCAEWLDGSIFDKIMPTADSHFIGPDGKELKCGQTTEKRP